MRFKNLDFFSKMTLAITFLIGLPFLSIGLYESYKNVVMTQTYVHTVGTVVDNSYSSVLIDGVASGAYHPVVEFIGKDNRKERFTEGIGSLPPDFEVGEKVEILYNPQDIKDVRINTWKRLWLVPTIFCLVGLLPIIVGLFVVRKIEASFKPQN